MIGSFVVSTLALAASCGGDGTGPGGGTIPPPVVTGVGTPTGPATTVVMQSGGGMLTSADGKVSVTIPNGALLTDTEIGIQMITATAPSGTSKTFRLTPDGIFFPTPVEVTINFDSSDVAGTIPELLTIATQLADGTWQILDASSVELSSPTSVTFSTKHFSDYTLLQGLQIRPASAEIDENANIIVTVKNCTTVADLSTETRSAFAYDCVDPNPVYQSMEEDDLPPLPTFRVDEDTWAANGVEGGNAVNGVVEGDNQAQYTAPARAPAGNPVAVSVHVRNTSGQDLQLVSHIRIRNSCGSNLRGQYALRASLCDPPRILQGRSSTTITDANPLYHLSADVQFVYDSATSIPGTVAVYYPVGTATWTPVDPCETVTPSTWTWTRTYPQSTGSFRIEVLNDTTSNWSAFAGLTFPTVYSDTCDPNDEPREGGAGGSYLIANGRFTGSYTFQGTRTIAGQTFTYSLSPVP
jgi:hypothetical protein